MLEKLKQIEEHYTELQNRLSLPEVYTDPEKVAKISREQKELSKIIESYRAFRKAEEDAEEAKSLLETHLEPDFHQMVQEELNAARSEMSRLQEELKLLLLPTDPNDSKNVIVEIRGGAGGEEAALFAHSLFRMYSMYAERRRWKIELLNLNETELGGAKELSFLIEGEGAYSRMKFESGVHRVQRVPETESSGRNPPGGFIRLPLPWRSCRKRRMWSLN